MIIFETEKKSILDKKELKPNTVLYVYIFIHCAFCEELYKVSDD
jgi:hypothetical protein